MGKVRLLANSPISSIRPFGEMRRLTEKELQEKKSKGLCYRCDERYNIGHRCRRRELSVMFIDDLDDVTAENDFSMGEPPDSPTEEAIHRNLTHWVDKT